MKKWFQIVAATTAMVLLAGCSQNQVLATLEASVGAAETVVQALTGTGKISPGAAQAIESAIANLPAAYEQTAAELSSNDPDAVKAVKIAGYYASTLAALQGVPDDARLYAQAIASSIQAFLATLAQTPIATAHAAGKPPVTAKYDAKELHSIAKRAGTLGEKLAALRAAQSK